MAVQDRPPQARPAARSATLVPYVPASQSLPEITLRALLLGVLLSVVLAAANAYLGLFAGLTVSASIPAAVVSMAVLRLVRNSNILENNIVQTSASAGESVALGVIFTLPALVLLGAWARFNYWETTVIAGFGGILGVLFTVPIRRALIVEGALRFPEGVATAEVLKAGEEGGSSLKCLLGSGLLGAAFKLGSTGLRLWGGGVEYASWVGGRTVTYFSLNLSPALVGVGYIVGLNIAVLVFLGGALNWFVAVPLLALGDLELTSGATEPAAFANRIWSEKTRYLGVGAMVVGGLWALIQLRSSLDQGLRAGVAAYRQLRHGGPGTADRTQRDTPMQWVGIGLVVALLPLYWIFWHFTHSPWVSMVMAVVMLVAGFLFSSVAGYMAGLVGSSNNPISGVTIATVLTSALLLLALLGGGSEIGPAAAILIGSVVACAAAIAGDNLQDLKAGYLLGATPARQQVMQGVGVIAAALVMAPVLNLLLEAYGIGTSSAANPEPLAAPQATLMAAVAGGVFTGDLPWSMVGMGMGVALAVIVLDLWLKASGSSFRAPVLAVAVGIYLPLELSAAIFAGGLVAWSAGRTHGQVWRQAGPGRKAALEEARAVGARRGLLFAAGLITGEALLGILLAVPIVLLGNAQALAIWGIHDASLPALILLFLAMWGLYRMDTSSLRNLRLLRRLHTRRK